MIRSLFLRNQIKIIMRDVTTHSQSEGRSLFSILKCYCVVSLLSLIRNLFLHEPISDDYNSHWTVFRRQERNSKKQLMDKKNFV